MGDTLGSRPLRVLITPLSVDRNNMLLLIRHNTIHGGLANWDGLVDLKGESGTGKHRQRS